MYVECSEIFLCVRRIQAPVCRLWNERNVNEVRQRERASAPQLSSQRFQGRVFWVSFAESKEKWQLIFLISALLAICYYTLENCSTILRGSGWFSYVLTLSSWLIRSAALHRSTWVNAILPFKAAFQLNDPQKEAILHFKGQWIYFVRKTTPGFGQRPREWCEAER